MAQITRRHTTATLLSATFALSITGLGLSPGAGPSFIPLIALLTTILVCTKPHNFQRYTAQWFTLTLSITLSHSGASINALSTPSISVIVLSMLSSISALVALTPIYLTHVWSQKLPNYRFLIFPTLWTLTWSFVSRLQPIGRLLTWTPLAGISSYEWILPILGLPGLDFICALWASTISEYVYGLLDDKSSENEVLLPDLMPSASDSPTKANPYRRLLPSLTFLLALTLPSFYTNSLPLPPHSDSGRYTPLGVACILPSPTSSSSQLKHFIDETKKYVARSKIMLWPEGAVTFESEAEKKSAISEIREEVFHNGQQPVWVGVSFLERVGVDEKKGVRDGQYRNGMMLVGQEGVEFTYYKRHLVPSNVFPIATDYFFTDTLAVAESFSQLSSSVPPPLYTIQPQNAQVVPKRRPVTLTASICLDFSSPLFPSNPSTPIPGGDGTVTIPNRPSLILAPARTWDIRIGEAMYSLARIRAKEVGAELLWCDGGSGGLSGVGSDIQVGWGSWSKDIGVPYNADSTEGFKRTVYATFGDFGVIIVILGVWGSVYVTSSRSMNELVVQTTARISDTSHAIHATRDWIRHRLATIPNRIRERITGNRTAAPLLIQIEEEEEERLI